ncbi:MAG: hypothetical protein MZU95_16415 [Desulfomicrobium escambiense]|nr:hypothetical protein [Desulfomicrobium escambiense]
MEDIESHRICSMGRRDRCPVADSVRDAGVHASQRRIRAGVADVNQSKRSKLLTPWRTAIRLFKRHPRDTCSPRDLRRRVQADFGCHRGFVDPLLRWARSGESQLCSSAIVARRTGGVAAAHMVAPEDEYRVDNPTVDGENFAERWNDDNGSRYRAFRTWCNVLGADLRLILQERGDFERSVLA